MTIHVSKTARLGDLDFDPVIMSMPGQEARLKDVEDLKASIPVHGLLQGLKVRIDAEGTRYLVTAGSRRLTALRWLRDNTGAIRGELVTNETEIPIVHSEESDAVAREQSVAENVQRVPPTISAEAQAYAAMAAHAKPKDIAARFGVSEKRVLQRLKLAALHPDVLASLDAEKITIAAAEAFTLEPDPAKQARHLKKASSWELDARSIKQAFTKELVSSKSLIARLIGEKAYAKAGGALIDDAFSGETWWTSHDLIVLLRDKHWEEQKAKWLAEGWSFVETAEEFGKGDTWACNYAERLKPDSNPDQPDKEPAFSKEQKGKSGVVYFPNAGTEPQLGVCRGKKAPSPRHREPDADLEHPGRAIVEALVAPLVEAARTTLRKQPVLALQVLVATLHTGMVAGNDPFGQLLSITGELDDAPDWVLTDEEYAERHEDAEGGPPPKPAPPPQGRNFSEALHWAQASETQQVLEYLAELVALSLVTCRYGGMDTADAEGLAEIGVGVPFDDQAYFAAIGKPLVLLALEDMTGKKLKGGKKDDFEALAIKTARETAWRPPQLRTAAYAGPSFITGEEAESDDEDEGEDGTAIAAE